MNRKHFSPLWAIAAIIRSMTFAAILLALGAARGEAAQRYFVKPDGNDADAGTSWGVAFQTLAKAAQTATQSGDEVWVAEGTYAENATVVIPAGVAFYGGFAGGEADLSERDWAAHPSIIDGQNTKQCVYSSGILDGFSITHGHAFDSYGGGIYNCGSVANCTVYGNSGKAFSGGIFSYKGTVRNCISWRNSDGDIIGLAQMQVTFSCFGEGTSGEGNLRCNPLFVNTSGDPSTWDLRLRDGSPCVDAGTLSGAPVADILSAARPGNDDKVCMGAYESPDAYLPGTPQGPGIRLYVNPNGGNDSSDGTSWATALRTISRAQVIIAADEEFHDVWVADGVCADTSTIHNPARVSLYGGFAGNETDLSQRDWAAHPTIIDGENTRRCVSNGGILDGFFITNGRAANDAGGGIFNSGSVINCMIYNNTALRFGGGIYSTGSVTNCAVYGNTVEFNGSGIRQEGGSVTNCTVYGNTGTSQQSPSGGIDSYWGSITNCIAWGNTTFDIRTENDAVISYSCFKEGTTGTGNIASDPQFVNVSGDMSTWDLRLRLGSPCIDAGTSESAPAADILGVARPQGQGFDMGAYERVPRPCFVRCDWRRAF